MGEHRPSRRIGCQPDHRRLRCQLPAGSCRRAGLFSAACTAVCCRPKHFCKRQMLNRQPSVRSATTAGELSAEVHGRSAGNLRTHYTAGYDQFNLLIHPICRRQRAIVIKNSSGNSCRGRNRGRAVTRRSSQQTAPVPVYPPRSCTVSKGRLRRSRERFQVSTESGQLILVRSISAVRTMTYS